MRPASQSNASEACHGAHPGWQEGGDATRATQTEGPLRQLVRAHWAEILELAHRHGAQDVQITGSVARGTETPASDIDFLVTFEPGRTLFDLAALSVGPEELLDVHVDVISRDGLKQRDEATFLETTAAM